MNEAPSSQDILRSLILLVRHFGGEGGTVRISQGDIQKYITEFGNDQYSLGSNYDPETQDVLLSLERHQAPTPSEPAGE